MEQILGDQKRHRPATHKRLSKDMKKPCFVFCGLCPGDERGWEAYRKLAAEEDIDMTTPVDANRITSSCSDSQWITIDNYEFLLVYTDGSALNTSDRLTARAGFGVWYSELSPHNGIEKLAGPVQTSYKAEARALLHVVRTAGVPTCIMCDCLSVVNLFNAILNDSEQELEKCADGELWKVIRELLKAAPANFFKCKWVPSHLNDPKHKNHAKRQKYLDDGATSEEHIEGNSKADALVGKGVLLHDADSEALYAISSVRNSRASRRTWS